MGILTNLALRTLEFWVDNLHPDYLYPIFAMQDDDGTGLCELFMALTRHLLPAPYPYGLLCMRLLGKMGGMNRLFLIEMVRNVDSKRTEGKRGRIANECENLSMHCEWQRRAGDEPSSEMSFLLPFPLDRAVEVLRCLATAPSIIAASHGKNSNQNSRRPSQVTYGNFDELLSVDTKTFDLNRYSQSCMLETRANQSESAFTVLRAALASTLDIDDEEENGRISFCTQNGAVLSNNDAIDLPSDEEGESDLELSQQGMNYNHDFKLVCDGLFAASNHDNLKDEAMLILKGLGSHIFYLLLSHRADITRIDRDGCSIDPFHGDESSSSMDNEKHNSQNHIAEKIQFNSFGCFRLSGQLDCGNIDPFVFNEALADAFTDSGANSSHFTAMGVMHHVVELFHRVKGSTEATLDEDKDEPKDAEMKGKNALHFPDTTNWGDVFFENLLSKLCHNCFSQPWNHRSGVMSGLFNLIVKMGLRWSHQYEVEIIHTAMFVVKDTPDGIAHASKASVGFFLQVSWFFFGGPSSWKESSTVIHDVMSPTATDIASIVNVDNETPPPPISVKPASLTLILSEIASTKPLVR
jgi:transformation/transcription domain-associated protein